MEILLADVRYTAYVALYPEPVVSVDVRYTAYVALYPELVVSVGVGYKNLKMIYLLI